LGAGEGFADAGAGLAAVATDGEENGNKTTTATIKQRNVRFILLCSLE
jgi:hypothetical protein